MVPDEQPDNLGDGATRTPWIRFGCILPSALRTRVFEPAYFDLLATHDRTARSGRHFGLQVIALALETYRVGAPQLAWEVARRSRRTWLFAGLALMILLAFLALKGATPHAPVPYRPGGP